MSVLAILGLGLMGGSLGLALRQDAPHAFRVRGSTRSRARGELALKRGAIDAFFDDPCEAVKDADIVVCCAPILAIADQVAAVADALKPGAVVTDVGSTKAFVQERCAAILKGTGAVFVGSHPIAGSDQQGMEAARVDLYEQAMVVVTPDPDTPVRSVGAIRSLWERVGGIVIEMPPDEHDRILAATSHLPHMVASLLAATVGRSGLRPDLPRFCGSGYRDTTRIAGGGVDIWLDIVRSNAAPLKHELTSYATLLNDLIEMLEREDYSAIKGLLEIGKESRQGFIAYGTQGNNEE